MLLLDLCILLYVGSSLCLLFILTAFHTSGVHVCLRVYVCTYVYTLDCAELYGVCVCLPTGWMTPTLQSLTDVPHSSMQVGGGHPNTMHHNFRPNCQGIHNASVSKERGHLGTWSRIEWELNSFPIPRHEHNVLCFWNGYWWKVSSVQLINIVFSAVWFAAYKPPRQWLYWMSLILHLNMDPRNQMIKYELFHPHNFFYALNYSLKRGRGDVSLCLNVSEHVKV